MKKLGARREGELKGAQLFQRSCMDGCIAYTLLSEISRMGRKGRENIPPEGLESIGLSQQQPTNGRDRLIGGGDRQGGDESRGGGQNRSHKNHSSDHRVSALKQGTIPAH